MEVLGCSGLLLSASGLQGCLSVLPPAHSSHSATCRYTEALPTSAFLAAMEEDDEIEVELSPNQNVIIKFKAVGELQPNGTREVGSVNASAKGIAALGKVTFMCLIRTCKDSCITAMAKWSACWSHQQQTCSCAPMQLMWREGRPLGTQGGCNITCKMSSCAGAMRSAHKRSRVLWALLLHMLTRQLC